MAGSISRILYVVKSQLRSHWASMRNMRNRMAHGYFDINLDVVWETVQEWLPALLKQLPVVRQDADDEDRNGDGMES